MIDKKSYSFPLKEGTLTHRIVHILRTSPPLEKPELAAILGVPVAKVHSAMESLQLRKKSFIERKGEKFTYKEI